MKGKRVLLRCDLNEPLGKSGVEDTFRIEKSLEGIRSLVEKEAKVIIMSHLGRPGGKRVDSLSMSPIQEVLVELLDQSVTLAQDCIGKEIERWTHEMGEGEILLLENLRFRKGEIDNDKRFARRLARLGDLYINDAFGSSYRNHASIVRLPKLLPSSMGPLFKREVESLNQVFNKGPVVGIIGGSKVEKKSATVPGLLEKVDLLLVGGLVGPHLKGMDDSKLVSPIDLVEKEGQIMDIGPETVELFKSKIEGAGTVFWAGPMGDIRQDEFSDSSRQIAHAIIESGAWSVVGGGDTVGFVLDEGLEFDHLSTGGGSMLQFLSSGTLPGIEALN